MNEKHPTEMTDRELMHAMLDKLLDNPDQPGIICEHPIGGGKWRRAKLSGFVWTISCEERERQLKDIYDK